MARDRPFVVYGTFVERWRAMDVWTPSFFSSLPFDVRYYEVKKHPHDRFLYYNDDALLPSGSREGIPQSVPMNFQEFWKATTQNSDGFRYYFTTNLNNIPELKEYL